MLNNGKDNSFPDLLTEDEAIKFLRLDVAGPANPKNTLRYYRNRGLLKGTKIGRRVIYMKKSLLEFAEKMTS